MGPDPRKRIPSLGQPVPAQPGNEWSSLQDKWGISRAEVQQQVANAPPQAAAIVRQGLEGVAPTAAPVQPAKTLESMAPTGPNVPSFNNRSVPDFQTARGGYVGATTDAEAQRNLQSRFEQDAAASQMVASMNRGADALRDTRAAQLGIGRGTLDQMEGRMDSPNIPRSAPETPKLPGLFDRPGDGFGDAGMRQAKFEGMLSDAGSLKGFGSRRKGERMVSAALGMLQPGLENQKNTAGLMGQQLDAQTAQAKNLSDLYQRNSMTPYQQAQLGLEQQKLGAMLGDKQQASFNKGLDNLQSNLYGSQEFKNYVTTQPMMQTVRDLAAQDTPTAGTALATAVAKSRDPSTGVLQGEVEAIKSGSGNIPQRMYGWVNSNILGGSPFSPGVRQDLVNATEFQTNNYRDQAMAKVDSLMPELQQRGIPLNTVLNEKDLATYQEWKTRQPGQGQGTQQKAAYTWDGEKLVPVQ